MHCCPHTLHHLWLAGNGMTRGTVPEHPLAAVSIWQTLALAAPVCCSTHTDSPGVGASQRCQCYSVHLLTHALCLTAAAVRTHNSFIVCQRCCCCSYVKRCPTWQQVFSNNCRQAQNCSCCEVASTHALLLQAPDSPFEVAAHGFSGREHAQLTRPASPLCSPGLLPPHRGQSG